MAPIILLGSEQGNFYEILITFTIVTQAKAAKQIEKNSCKPYVFCTYILAITCQPALPPSFVLSASLIDQAICKVNLRPFRFVLSYVK